MQTLEDQMMNLSSMMSSRFVAPFLEQTQKWERLMSNISEVIEVWMKVQSKWMYLEAIFIGAEDIRLQLPEEAKRFDRIHATFKKIMAEDAEEPQRPRRLLGRRAARIAAGPLRRARGVPEVALRLPRDEAHLLPALLLLSPPAARAPFSPPSPPSPGPCLPRRPLPRHSSSLLRVR